MPPDLRAAERRSILEAGEVPIVEMAGISKQFPGVLANADISLAANRGEIHALLGENGAGKSTLMNILTGIYQPDAGSIRIDKKPVMFGSPLEAIAAGIGMVHQHFKLVQAFSVAENIHLGWKEAPSWVSRRALKERTTALSRRFNLPVDPAARIADLSAAEQQRVEILRVLSRRARILVLDEPTAVLSPQEAKELFAALDAFRAAGNAVIFISHKLKEVLEISDRISVLRGGRLVSTLRTSECSASMLGSLMVGRTLSAAGRQPAATAGRSVPPVMSLKRVSVRNEQGALALKQVSLDVFPCEILGIAGVAGNGQRELSEAMTGLRPLEQGCIAIDGAEVGAAADAATFLALGVGHIPEDRLKRAIAPDLAIAENAILREYRHPPISRGLVYRPAMARSIAGEIVSASSVNVPDMDMPVRNLSGGNQQRLVARREMRVARKVLVAAYPSRGLDVGAIETMFAFFGELRQSGAAVVLISEELDELLAHADRIAVMYEGEISGVRDAASADVEEIGLMMGGRRKGASHA